MRNRVLARSVVTLSVLVVAVLGGPSGHAGDEVDRAEAARRAWDAKDYARAAAAYELAWEAKPADVDSLYRAAQAYEKAGNGTAACHAYRAFLGAFDQRTKEGKPPATLKAKARKAEKCLRALDKKAAAVQKLQDRDAAKLVAFAEKHLSSDPLVALRALEHAEALASESSAFAEPLAALRRKFDVPADRMPSPFEQRVVGWKDLIAERTLGATDGWSYAPPGLRIENKGEGRLWVPAATVGSGSRYVYEIEMKVLEVFDKDWYVGPVVGYQDGRCFSVLFGAHGVDVLKVASRTPTRIGGVPHELGSLKAWHRLSLRADGSRCELWVDGDKVHEFTVPAGWSTDGYFGLFTQTVRCQIRELRIGALR